MQKVKSDIKNPSKIKIPLDGPKGDRYPIGLSDDTRVVYSEEPNREDG